MARGILRNEFGEQKRAESATMPRRALTDAGSESDMPGAALRVEGVGHGSLSLTGAWLGADGAMCAMLGRTASEICQTTLSALTHADDVTADAEQLERLRRHEIEAYHLEKRLLHRDGHVVWVAQIVWAICDDRGTRLHLSCQLAPVEPEPDAADAACDRQTLPTGQAPPPRNSAVVASSEAVISLDGSRCVTRMNGAAQALTGLTLARAVGRPLDAVVRIVDEPTRSPVDILSDGTCALSAGVARPNLILISEDGSERSVAATCVPLAARGVMLILRDTTEDLRAAQALRRSEASFRALIERSPELILVHRDDRIAYLNPAALRALGYSREELLGKSFLEIVHADDRALLAPRSGDRPSRTALPPIAVRWRCKLGEYRTTEAIDVPVEFDGSPAVVVAARDVTERNEIHAQLLRTDRMAALGTLAAGVAHEINNPLTYLLVNVEYVLRRIRALAASKTPLEDLENDESGNALHGYAQSLSHAVEGANRVRQIVRDLMTFSNGNVEQRGLVDLRGVLESSIQMAWHEIRHRARLVKNLQEVPPVEANEARLGQVFLSLLVNAAQAIPEGDANNQEVRVTTRPDDDGHVIIEVSDSGGGIAPESLPRIFDPFFTTKSAGAGMGLGLSISHGTVKSLGGELQVETTPGKGTLFRVTLPAAKSYRGRSPNSSPQIRPCARKRILVIDDEPLVSQAIARVLGDENDVKVVKHAPEALELIAGKAEFDLILCDLMMPVMTGMDLFAEVVKVAPHLAGRIVFMTGGAFTPRARSFVESISNPCLEKPLEMSKLKSLIARAGEKSLSR